MNGTIFTYNGTTTKHFIREATHDECRDAIKAFPISQLNAGGVFTADIYIGTAADPLTDLANVVLIQVIVPLGSTVASLNL